MTPGSPRTFALAACFVLVLAAVVVAAPSRSGDGSAPVAEADATVTQVVIEGYDSDLMHATVFKPAGATAAEPVPIVLHSHGWSGARTNALPSDTGHIVRQLVYAGYGVISIDARGHGDSGGEANVHNKNVEVHDFKAILDWIHDELPWVEKETDSGIAKDIVAGATGGSYGGGFQLMTASHDHRLDALVPEITWNDLTYSLGSQGVVKSVWVDGLYGLAKASGTRILPAIDQWFLEAHVENEFPQAAYSHFLDSSPEPENIQAHVLLIQGIPDLLFNLNEAMANFQALESGVAGDVRLSTHLTGHVLPGVQPIGPSPYSSDPSKSRHPCGSVNDKILAWFDEHLRGNVGAADAIPKVAYALENGECIHLDALNEETVTATFASLAAPQMGGSLLVPILQGPALVAGIPHISADALTALPTKFNLGLVVMGPASGAHVVNDQSTGILLKPGEGLDHDLAGVATRLDAGDQMFLRIDGLNEWYLHNGGRMAGGVVFTDVVVTLPLVTEKE